MTLLNRLGLRLARMIPIPVDGYCCCAGFPHFSVDYQLIFGLIDYRKVVSAICPFIGLWPLGNKWKNRKHPQRTITSVRALWAWTWTDGSRCGCGRAARCCGCNSSTWDDRRVRVVACAWRVRTTAATSGATATKKSRQRIVKVMTFSHFCTIRFSSSSGSCM